MKKLDLGLEDYEKSLIGIKLNKKSKENIYDRWCEISLDIENSYFKYDEKGEMLLESELYEIYEFLEKCLNNELSEDKELSFLEPDLEIKLFKSSDSLDFIGELKILLKDSSYSDYYAIFLNESSLKALKNYLGKVLKISLVPDTKPLKYVSVVYDDLFDDYSYYYKTSLKDIAIGDTVLVERNNNKVYGTVQDIEYYDENKVLYPLEKTKDILKVIKKENSSKEDIFSLEEVLLKDYRSLLLYNMFGMITITILMNLIKNTVNEKLYYYPKFNTFFYKNRANKCRLALYNEGLIDESMFDIIIEDSILVHDGKPLVTSMNKAYVLAREFCQIHNLSYYDDTDIFEFQKEKTQFCEEVQEEEEIKSFNSLKEVKDYLKNSYKPAKYEVHNPRYYIENDHIVYFAGFLTYDLRVFKILEFLEKNNYIFKKYYNREKYPEFFNENWCDYDYKNLDIKRASYMLFRIFNIERINEGTIDHMINKGIMLKLIERVEELKKD